MIIKKVYKFYAAHRNEELHDKCFNLHGHRYELHCFFEVERQGSITTLFGDFDAKIKPLIKREYDHGLLVHRGDTLFETLLGHTERTGERLRCKVLPGPTSLENLAFELFSQISELGFTLARLTLSETDTSTLIYTREDFAADRRVFARAGLAAATATGASTPLTPA